MGNDGIFGDGGSILRIEELDLASVDDSKVEVHVNPVPVMERLIVRGHGDLSLGLVKVAMFEVLLYDFEERRKFRKFSIIGWFQST